MSRVEHQSKLGKFEFNFFVSTCDGFIRFDNEVLFFEDIVVTP